MTITNVIFYLYSKEKTHINVVVIGHVDSGKSTTTGKRSPQTSLRKIHKLILVRQVT